MRHCGLGRRDNRYREDGGAQGYRGGGQALTEENVKLLSVGVKFLICFDDALSSKKSNFGTGLYLAGCYAAGVSGGVTALTGLKTVTWLMSMLILEVVQKKVLQKAS